MRRSWATVTYELPFVNGDFVLLTGRFDIGVVIVRNCSIFVE